MPAVVLLDEALHAWESASQAPPGGWYVSAAKFTAAVQPGQTLIIEHEHGEGGTVRFSVAAQGVTVASGVLRRTHAQ